LFDRPVAVIETSDPTDVLQKLRAVDEAVDKQGLYAAGALAYEAAPAFDPALRVPQTDRAAPLLWFGLFLPPRPITLGPASEPLPSDWTPSVTADDYRSVFNLIKHHIHEGDTYQVNLTYRLRAEIGGQRSEVGDQQAAGGGCRPCVFASPSSDHRPPAAFLPLFTRLVAAQKAAYGVFISTPRWSLCSASPELFFCLDGTRIVSRPMKGTAPRGLTLDEDRAMAAALQVSEKNRAENLMIVDMVRNDLGRIAIPGTVSVPELFTLEKYPTVWQLTSTVEAETQASPVDIFTALFPAASITGAPKSRAMRIIAENERGPRGFYTGAAGFMAPNRRAQFNVTIRSLFIDVLADKAEYGTGGGIVWDSQCEPEQAESRTKARVLNADATPFSLLETMLWTPAEGVTLLERHLARLAGSAEYFDIPADLDAIRQGLANLGQSLLSHPHRVRLLVAQDGHITLETAPFLHAVAPDAPPLRAAFAPRPVDRNDPFLYHKTTRRRVYEEALAACPGVDDVILWNTDGEVTESTRANVVAELGGVLCTSPVRCGLLPGTFRQHLLDTGEVVERVLTPGDLQHASRVWLANSLRGLRPIRREDLVT
jgi:para-aminobenzoate synthetase/4-amino-4-deoxychorismate lyase